MDFRNLFFAIFKSNSFDFDQSFGSEILKSMLTWTGSVVSLGQYTQGELFIVSGTESTIQNDLSLPPGPRLVKTSVSRVQFDFNLVQMITTWFGLD